MADETKTRDYREAQAPSLGVPYLEVVRGGEHGLPTRLQPGTSIAGRGASCDIRFDIEGVSRKHARFGVSESGAVEITDLGSHNGTFVNGRPIESEKLRAGDQIRLGPIVVSLVYAGGADRVEADDAVALSPREYEVASLVAEGLTNAEIAKRLFISAATVGRHLSNVYERLDIHSRAALSKYVTTGRVRSG
jgi:DNA-binding CsgD family transcriptional regulator